MEITGPVPKRLREDLSAWVQSEMALDPGASLGAMRGRAWAGRKVGRRTEAPPAVCELAGLVGWFAPQLIGLRWLAWPVVLWEGASIGWHDHAQAQWAAVTYLETPPDAGRICWVYGDHLPKAGDLLIMSGTERHEVKPGAGPRVSVALNFYAEGN